MGEHPSRRHHRNADGRSGRMGNHRKLQTTGVTMQLNVKYKKPVLTSDTQITVRGHLASQRRNIATIHLTLENSAGEICDEGEAVYFTFGPDKAREMGFNGCKVEGEG